jgi:CheY-like chemotaxis protein
MEKRVLLIDDEASLRRSVTMGLMQKGYQTESCENGMKGLEALETHKQRQMPLKGAVVDVQLPDIDGLKLLKVIKFNYPQLPVIVITGYGSDAIAEGARAADAYLEKPFNTEDLAGLLDRIEAKTENGEAETAEKHEAIGKEAVSMYAFVSCDGFASLMDAYRKLYFHQNVLYCDAIRGDHDLALLLQASDPHAINNFVEKELKRMSGVVDVVLMPVEAPSFADNVMSIIGSVDRALGRDKAEAEPTEGARQRVSSYVMMEIEKEKIEAIYPALYFNDQVVTCDCTDGSSNVVLLMRGTSFADIERTVRDRFKAMDGVLKVREYPIIPLFEA